MLIALLAIGNMYAVIRVTAIPMFGGERVLSRMICLPIFVLLLVGSLEFQKLLDRQMPHSHKFVLVGLVFMANDLWLHSQLWNVNAVAKVFGGVQLDLRGNSLTNHGDPPYFMTLKVGAALAVLTLGFLLLQSFREHGRKQGPLVNRVVVC
jgi:hypothetical protein